MIREKGILVTGAARGLGMLAAVELARRGHRVFAGLVDPNDTQRLDDACARAGVQVTTLHMDVTDAASIARSVDEMASAGAIDVLINNAGIVRVGFFETLEASQFDGVMTVNFAGTVSVTRAVLPIMRRQGHGVVVNMSSLMADVAEKEHPRLRYATGVDTTIVRLLRAILPWRMFEALFVAVVRGWMKGPRALDR